MKTHRKTKPARARVMFGTQWKREKLRREIGGPYLGALTESKATASRGNSELEAVPCAVIPTATAKKARAIVKAAPFLLMTEEEQRHAIASALMGYDVTDEQSCDQNGEAAWCYKQARAVLAAIGGAK